MPDGGLGKGNCTKDSDCKSQPYGFCSAPQGVCGCTYGCVTDADCPTGKICVCGDPVGQCVTAKGCTVDADCGTGLLCISSHLDCTYTFACQTRKDTCTTDDDCGAGDDAGDGDEGAVCAYQSMLPDGGIAASGFHACRIVACSGRPFLVGGAARVAAVVPGGDWLSDLACDAATLDDVARSVLAEHWTEVALMEHASIAAFARFALELLGLGAPPELVSATQQAMADEIVHARNAFALASSYAGCTLGPGTLDVGRALVSTSPLSALEMAIFEGCIGETVAAVEAAEALAYATDPAVRAALARVVEDETRHAELAWRFVRWILEEGSPAVRQGAARTLLLVVESSGDARPDGDAVPATESVPVLLAHGMLPVEMKAELRRRVFTEVFVPCAAALIASSATAQADRLARAERQATKATEAS